MKKNGHNRIFLILFIIGSILTIVYIFRTSTAMLNSDSVIVNALVHQQKINHQFLLTKWFYGNEFWLASLNIPIYILSFFINNNLLIRQISVLLVTILFYFLIYRYNKEFIEKDSFLILSSIFITGISYTVLDYFYAFNAYLTVLVNSLILFYFYYKMFMNNSKIYFYFTLLFTFVFCSSSIRYIPTVVIPFFVSLFILYVYHNRGNRLDQTLPNKFQWKKCTIIFVVILLSFLAYFTLTIVLHFDFKVSSGLYNPQEIIPKILNLFAGYFNLFGCDNLNNVFETYTGNGYFLDISKQFSIYSFWGIMIFIKTIVAISVLVFSKLLFKNLNIKIKLLLVFNNISLLITVYLYLVCDLFDIVVFENRYILFNVVIDIILSIYYIYKFLLKDRIYKWIVLLIMIVYLISNIIFTTDIIIKHNSKVINNKYRLVNILKHKNLTFGYAPYWNTLITYFLSDYQIEVAEVIFCDNKLVERQWYTNIDWYRKDYHTGETFLIIDEVSWKKFKKYFQKYEQPKEIIQVDSYKIFIYSTNPFSSQLEVNFCPN